MSSIHIDQLVARRDGSAIFEPISLDLDEPGAVEIVGPNGSGKTTFLRILAGLYGQYDGQYALPACLYQGHRLGLDELDSVAANLVWFAKVQGVAMDERAVRGVLATVGLLRQGLSQVGKLSQGQQRRACMARWLVSDNPVWLLDEPLTALDEAGQKLLVKLVENHVETGNWVLYSSHIGLELARKTTIEVCAL